MTQEAEKLSLDDVLNYQSSRPATPPPTPDKHAEDMAKEAAGSGLGDSVFDAAGKAEEKDKGIIVTQDQARPSRTSYLQARMIAKAIDVGFSRGLQAIAQHRSHKPFKADEEDMEDMIEQWALYIEQSDKTLSPLVLIFLLILVTYITKLPQAFELRRANRNKRAEEQQEKPQGRPAPAPDPPPVAGDYDIEDVEDEGEYLDVEAEEVTDEDVLLQAELAEINMIARSKGCPEFKHYKPIPGFCKYEWMVRGNKVPVQEVPRLQFADKTRMGRWSAMMSNYTKKGVPIPSWAKNKRYG